jgi:hypothetical protein
MVKQRSFKELWSGDEGGDHQNILTIFETQEVVLHNACCLLRMLALDNSKVRQTEIERERQRDIESNQGCSRSVIFGCDVTLAD